MKHVNRKLLDIKQEELAALDEPSKLQRVKLEEEIAALKIAARIEEETKMPSQREVHDELFRARASVMRRLLEEANGKAVHVTELATALGVARSTARDYFNDQPGLRPTECFWTNGQHDSVYVWQQEHPHDKREQKQVAATGAMQTGA